MFLFLKLLKQPSMLLHVTQYPVNHTILLSPLTMTWRIITPTGLQDVAHLDRVPLGEVLLIRVHQEEEEVPIETHLIIIGVMTEITLRAPHTHWLHILVVVVVGTLQVVALQEGYTLRALILQNCQDNSNVLLQIIQITLQFKELGSFILIKN